MSFSPQQEQPQANLEDRLRGLILKNAGQNKPPHPTQERSPQYSPQVPPHLRNASEEDKAEYFAAVAARRAAESAQKSAPPPGKQKRPNQAQRRQMNNQMSIPIDTRPVHHVQAGRSPGFGGQANSQHQNQGYNHQRSPIQQQYSPCHHSNQQSPHHQAFPARTPNVQQSFSNSSYSPSQPGSGPNQSRQGPHGFQPQHNFRPSPQNRQLYHPGNGERGRPFSHQENQDFGVQVSYLEKLLHECVPKVGIEFEEASEKEAFRAKIEKICQDTIAEFERGSGKAQFEASSVELQCFGSMRSGFATRASDMDLALLAPKCIPDPHSPESRIPRLLEKKLLALGYGARLLTRTRVPIIKLCQKPTEKLLSDLREERGKWDNGILDDEDERGKRGTDTNFDQPLSPTVVQKRASSTRSALRDSSLPLGQLTQESDQSPMTPTLATVNEEAYVAKLRGLQQQQQQSLHDYHNAAKRLLRKLGGRDITANSPDLDELEVKVLDDVCKAFVLGLMSVELSSRLQQYPSIRPLFSVGSEKKQRSLQSIWTQAEGERLAMAFDQRSYVEFQDKLELEAASAVGSWFELQEKTGAVLDPVFFGRQLHSGLEKLKKITSLQILYLEQMPFEDPTAYFARTQKMQQALRSRALQISVTSMEDIAAYVVEKYILGINDQSIREAIKVGRLSDVYRQHVILQLALDYEHALELSLFEDADTCDIKRYIDLLRTRDRAIGIEPTLIQKMRSLPDPTQVSTLKPRDPYKDKLEFPKTEIGIQCDINFSAQLAIHNTLLLRCYAAGDIRVQPMILFVKHWAKVRGVNTPYRGTLSSYGYVLMVLHYLTNIAQPFVCPNLQLVNKDPPSYLTSAEREARSICEGRDVRFWRNEAEIKSLADRGMLNHNKDLLGYLLRGFFEYYAQNGPMTTVHMRGFDWGREVLSLRTQGGIMTKQEKGWTGAKTVVETSTIAAPPTQNKKDGVELKQSTKTMEETKEIRYRYLFAIEDPFELDHNVARTVTHNGIVNIRDEFRRAWRIIRNVGKDTKEGLLDPLPDGERKNGLKEAMDIIHGPENA